MTTSREFSKRLAALQGGSAAPPSAEMEGVGSPPSSPVAPREYRRELPATLPVPPPPVLPQLLKPVRLDDAVQGEEISVPVHGRAFHLATVVTNPTENGLCAHQDFLAAFAATSGWRRRLALRGEGVGVTPADVIFVDVETTGLAHSPLFLIGTLAWEGGDLVARQYLARHYGEEAAVTALFVERAREKRLLISFNGKSFDFPYLRARAAANAVPFTLALTHFDLLHECRRIWKGILPNCKLQTLEQCICGHAPRYGDIPGAEIPEAYHRYVRTANAAQIVTVLKHNLLDLVTLAELIGRLPAPVEK